jgi:hypothetical protein
LAGISLSKTSSAKPLLSVQTIVLLEITWAVLALLFFLLFSVPIPGQGRPYWYSVGTSVFETVAFVTAAILCFRNYGSAQIVSGRNVWGCIGLGMLFYFIGGLLFSYWELGLGIEADVSPGDFFYVLTYICLIIGMLLAVMSRRLNLEIWQWGVVAVIAAIGIALASLVSLPANKAQALLIQPAAAQTSFELAAKPTPGKASPKPTAKPSVTAAPAAAPAATASPSPAAPQTVTPVPSGPHKAVPSESAEKPVPEWAKALKEQLAPLKPALDWFYVISDILLLIIATTLLLAFWGGRFAQSWRMIAAAAFCLYIADIWFKYATNRLANYQSGGLLEVFWVFSGVLFGIGAVLEYDLSSRTRSRSGGRRRAS